ncbi:hypothetical protein ACO0M4_28225 [Streptomyces sp. RGM 3693]|uniref:hypothetical protein n=1 Tax=Streptomyces sp. RGM 3693 TaxID=3413284 RepID=UPI003D28DCF8
MRARPPLPAREPFRASTRERLNAIKARESYRPIAGGFEDPYMLYFRKVRWTGRLRGALVVREFVPDRDQASRYVLYAGQELARSGHRVHLVSERGEFEIAQRHGLEPMPLPEPPTGTNS